MMKTENRKQKTAKDFNHGWARINTDTENRQDAKTAKGRRFNYQGVRGVHPIDFRWHDFKLSHCENFRVLRRTDVAAAGGAGVG